MVVHIATHDSLNRRVHRPSSLGGSTIGPRSGLPTVAVASAEADDLVEIVFYKQRVIFRSHVLRTDCI